MTVADDQLSSSAEQTNDAPIMKVDGLKTYFFTRQGTVKAVDGVSFELKPRETLAIVGESGCGKSITALSLLRLIPYPPGRIIEGSIELEGVDLMTLDEDRMREIRGNDISMIFQEPMTSLNPVMTVARQISEALILHQGMNRAQALARSIEMLEIVGIPEPHQRVKEYPHQLSGGMRQRVMIAMALACNPKVLIADEPTTALDVTIQAQILNLMVELQNRLGTAVILITHDLGVVAETAQRVIVMYAGRKVEEASVENIFANAQHPYTHGLLASIPRLDLIRGTDEHERLQEIPGIVPALSDLPTGCAFAPRCKFADEKCIAEYPVFEQKNPGHWAACWHADALYGGAK
jgi:peptide/nickel transport system ATP-binding protein